VGELQAGANEAGGQGRGLIGEFRSAPIVPNLVYDNVVWQAREDV